jgi:hypothetical protein
MIEGTVTAKVLSSRKRGQNEDNIGERQLFRERSLSIEVKILPGRDSTPRPSAYKTGALPPS